MRSPNSFTKPGDAYQTFKEELTLILHNLFQKTEQEGTLPNSFYEDNINLIPKDSTRKENYGSIQLMNIDGKFLRRILVNPIKQHIKEIIMAKSNLFQVCKVG